MWSRGHTNRVKSGRDTAQQEGTGEDYKALRSEGPDARISEAVHGQPNTPLPDK